MLVVYSISRDVKSISITSRDKTDVICDDQHVKSFPGVPAATAYQPTESKTQPQASLYKICLHSSFMLEGVQANLQLIPDRFSPTFCQISRK